jgi:signal transduction histidine kinase
MELKRSHKLAAVLLAAAWLIVVGWQVQEHLRVVEVAKSDLRKRSAAIASTLGAVVRGLQFHGAVFRTRLEPVLDELVAGDTNGAASGEVISIALLNAAAQPVAAAGRPIDLDQKDILQAGEHWGLRSMTRVYSVEGAFLNAEGSTNSTAPLILEPRTNSMRGGPRNFPRREPGPDGLGTSSPPNAATTNGFDTNTFAAGPHEPPPEGGFMPPPDERFRPPFEDGSRPRRPFWARDLDDHQYQELVASRELHGLVLTVSTESLQVIASHDFWLRAIIVFFAGISALGTGLAWRNTARTAELQIRLVRASELNSHLKELNLAAAGLAHETRNPLNLIRGQAQMIARLPDAAPGIREKSKIIVDETDKVTAQLTEFINYSRPREVRRTKVALTAACSEIVRTLAYDIEAKKLRVEVGGDPLAVAADEQLLRQVLFNLLINATQAVNEGGQIKIEVRRANATEAVLEVRDDGPGVPPENRQEVFKPGLGLAVVQQIVLAHGWEITCLPNEPRGAVFRLTHLKIVI